MRGAWRWLILLAVVTVTGCAATAPTFDEVAGSLPPVPPGAARIFVYRGFEPYQSLSFVPVFFNGAQVGAVGPGKVIMRDVPAPGSYTIAAKSQGLWPNQNKTVLVQPGQTVYAQIQSLRGLNPTANRPVPQTTFVVVLQDTVTGRRQIGPLWYEAQRQKSPAASG